MSLRGRTLVAATMVLTGLGTTAQAHAQQHAGPVPSPRQQVYAQAAQAYHVPDNLLLAVSYLESRWDANKGTPSTSGGFGPMHLVDGTLVPSGEHFADGDEDPRGDTSRPALHPKAPANTARTAAPNTATLQEAARLTGDAPTALRTDPAANIRGGAALLARYQQDLGKPLSGDPADWYAATVRYGGTDWFAGQVYDLIRTGASRTIDDGRQIALAADPGVRTAARAANDPETECPRDLGCEWIPAPYQQISPYGPTDYGNHDLGDRPKSQKIDFIVIHDTEGYYPNDVKMVQDPTYLGWNYTVRSADGHVAQHLKARDVGWQAGNWYINSKSLGIEHEGFLAQGGTWYTEAMYRSSSELVRYLARRFHVPLDRAHILGHDNVPATTPAGVVNMHEDPGPYWDWAHYFDLLHRPLHASAGRHSGEVMILPDYDKNVVPYTGCDAKNPSVLCPPHGGGSIMLRTEPRDDAPLVKDIGKHPTTGGTATMSVYDHSARAATGQTYAVADRQGDWTAIWYLGQKAWFHDPRTQPAAVGARGLVAVAKPGAASVPVYGRAYPEAEAYPASVPVQDLVPMQYTFAAGQAYAVVGSERGEYYYTKRFDRTGATVVKGRLKYYEIQFGHRVYFVKADDVDLKPAW
ncbi:N-acetylmuramoyl-L-alanine amidase [Actinoallomurus purpureus]|uniref:N-acetylmuramoyl-L-alanine amidase n=1 Tax=Actinoallomurus purpureus TaxID=478114 RepID=UPI002092E46C|nr:peptidoglycan recognition family protein [Actinoallomurus purpureus]MCO6007480.1 N-acetylmuramoyl-L-alanine amidase [Actinoallomurus purpureus]